MAKQHNRPPLTRPEHAALDTELCRIEQDLALVQKRLNGRPASKLIGMAATARARLEHLRAAIDGTGG